MYCPNPKGSMLISGSADECIRIWDMAKNKISPYISMKRPTDSVVINQKGEEDIGYGGSGKSSMDEGKGDPMRGVVRKK